MAKERHRPCSEPGCDGRVMTDELRRGYNAKVGGKIKCPDCVVKEIYGRFGL